ncbi:FecR domain-containing protein [Piscinibacter aquaticus]|uniref:FecR domain-containing protein n=1 Tax=Piscinibacter aquaticus TaxID=392597 RepID=A0A5C6TY63_9BURK|nr:FecR domain-containing protein [Piscinibacter aquaticus]
MALTAHAAPIGTVTIVDGEAAIVREAQRFAATEGLRLREDDIVRTGSGTALLRIELPDGTALDLGPATELMLQPRAGSRLGERAALLYLARGWLKVTAGAGGAAGLASPLADVRRLDGTAVLSASAQAALLFVEAGRAHAAEGGRNTEFALSAGDALVRRAGEPATAARRPPADLLAGLPRAFADSLPRRAARFVAAPAAPGPAQPVAFSEVSSWIDGEASLRSHAAQRFASRAGDREFRAALLAGLRSHPEWDRTLFPEKYRPKPVVVVQRADTQALSLRGVMAWPTAASPDTMENPR